MTDGPGQHAKLTGAVVFVGRKRGNGIIEGEDKTMAIADLLVAELPPLRQEPDGTIRVGDTRVTLDLLIESYADGMTAEEIAEAYTTLDLGDVYSAIAYYHHHRPEIDEYLRSRSERAEISRQFWEERSSSAGLRDKLLARRSSNACAQ
jgi:uncharacterized protein (DUF433 family)